MWIGSKKHTQINLDILHGNAHRNQAATKRQKDHQSFHHCLLSYILIFDSIGEVPYIASKNDWHYLDRKCNKANELHDWLPVIQCPLKLTLIYSQSVWHILIRNGSNANPKRVSVWNFLKDIHTDVQEVEYVPCFQSYQIRQGVNAQIAKLGHHQSYGCLIGHDLYVRMRMNCFFCFMQSLCLLFLFFIHLISNFI